MKNFKELKAEFSALCESKDNFEGYILLSDKEPRILESAPLPDFDLLCNRGNFIVESALFCKSRNECICIRQINDSFLVQRFCLESYPHKNFERFITIDNRVAKIAQIWEAELDENCENLPVLKHKFSIFAGFESREFSQDFDKDFEVRDFENHNKGGENG